MINKHGQRMPLYRYVKISGKSSLLSCNSRADRLAYNNKDRKKYPSCLQLPTDNPPVQPKNYQTMWKTAFHQPESMISPTEKRYFTHQKAIFHRKKSLS